MTHHPTTLGLIFLGATMLCSLASAQMEPSSSERPTMRPVQMKTVPAKPPAGGNTAQLVRIIDLVPKAKYPIGPLSGAPESGYCGSNFNGGAAKQVVVQVMNNGNVAAGAFKIRVTFDKLNQSQERNYAGLAPNQAPATHVFDIPNGAWYNHHMPFTVVVDAHNAVKEKNENNNKVKFSCVAPAM